MEEKEAEARQENGVDTKKKRTRFSDAYSHKPVRCLKFVISYLISYLTRLTNQCIYLQINNIYCNIHSTRVIN